MKYRMMRRSLRIVLLCFLVLGFRAIPAHAAGGLSITEIMYDPAGSDDKREWVEVYNGSSAGIDMTGHTILTDGLTSTHHALTPQGSSVIPSGGYSVIVQDVNGFKGDYPGYAGLIFDSSWTGLTTTVGKTIAILDAQSAVLDSVTYDPAVGGSNDGNSLQKNDAGAWVAALPTPGASMPGATASSSSAETNTATVVSGTTDAATNNGTPSTPAPAPAPAAAKPPLVSVPELSASLAVPQHAIAGIPVKISDKVQGFSGELRTYGSAHFALGDGSAHDGPATDSFSYTYAYPGNYVIEFEYRVDAFSADSDARARATIEVSAPSVAITAVAADGSIELTNPGSREADISGWILAPSGEAFSPQAVHVPSGTVILPADKIVLSHAVTGISSEGAEAAILMLPAGLPANVFAGASVSAMTTAAANTPAPAVVSSAGPSVQTIAEPSAPPAGQKKSASSSKGSATSTALAASAVSAGEDGLPQQAAKKGSGVAVFFVGFFAILAVGAGALWKLNRVPRSNSDVQGDAIRIVEE